MLALRGRRGKIMLKRQLRRYEEGGDKAALEGKCEELRLELQAEKQKVDMAEAAVEREQHRSRGLESEVEGVKIRLEIERKKSESFMLEIVGYTDREKELQEEVRRLKEEVGVLESGRKELLEALPRFVRKLHASCEFAKEMALVQRKAMALGAHRNLERLQSRNSKLDITKLDGYNPEAMSELKTVAQAFQSKEYAYISQLSSGSRLSVAELLAVEPAPFPEAPLSSSSAAVTS